MATNVDVKTKLWDAGPRLRLQSGWLTADGNGDEYLDPDGPFGVVIFGAVSVRATGALSLQLQHRTGSGGSWTNAGSALTWSAGETGKKVVAIAGVQERVRVVRDLTGTGAKHLISEAAVVPDVPTVAPQDLDSGTATAADIVAALVALGLANDTAV